MKNKVYIERNSIIADLENDLKNDGNKYYDYNDKLFRDAKYEFAIDIIKDAPVTNDVVKVIRCCDCKYYQYAIQYREYVCTRSKVVNFVVGQDFCSKAKKVQ